MWLVFMLARAKNLSAFVRNNREIGVAALRRLVANKLDIVSAEIIREPDAFPFKGLACKLAWRENDICGDMAVCRAAATSCRSGDNVAPARPRRHEMSISIAAKSSAARKLLPWATCSPSYCCLLGVVRNWRAGPKRHLILKCW